METTVSVTHDSHSKPSHWKKTGAGLGTNHWPREMLKVGIWGYQSEKAVSRESSAKFAQTRSTPLPQAGTREWENELRWRFRAAVTLQQTKLYSMLQPNSRRLHSVLDWTSASSKSSLNLLLTCGFGRKLIMSVQHAISHFLPGATGKIIIQHTTYNMCAHVPI